MKIIITGSEGLIGTQLSSFLEKNHEVIKLDLLLGNDLTDESFVKDWFSKNKADSIVNCFALNDHVKEGEKRGTLFEQDLQTLSEYFQVNLVSLFSVCREFAHNNPNSSIVNFAATTGIVSARPDLYDGTHKDIGYSISKAGVINLTKYLATHLAPDIRVNCISPAGVYKKHNKKFVEQLSERIPLGRMAKPYELNGAIIYLCSNASSYVTGHNLVVDGGRTSW